MPVLLLTHYIKYGLIEANYFLTGPTIVDKDERRPGRQARRSRLPLERVDNGGRAPALSVPPIPTGVVSRAESMAERP